MKHAEINGIEFEYPDSFTPLSQVEMSKYYSSTTNRWAARAAGQHTIISVGWTNPLNVLTSFLVSPKSFRENYEKQYGKSLKGFKRGEDLSFEICGAKAEGFAFSYEASDTGGAQIGMLITFSLAKQIYIAECSSGDTDKAFCGEAFETVLHSIRMK